MIPLEIFDFLSKMLSIVDAIFQLFKPGEEPVKQFFENLKKELYGLNNYQLESIDAQRTVSIMLFENLPFTILLLMVKFNLLKCDVLNKDKYQKAVMTSFASSILSLLMNLVESKFTAMYFNETLMQFLMNKMTANSRWYPLKHLFQSRNFASNMNFGDLAVEIPVISHTFGYYKESKFSFDDDSLEDLLNELVLWN